MALRRSGVRSPSSPPSSSRATRRGRIETRTPMGMERSCMPRGNRDHGRGGQSIVELVVVLALVAIVATAVVKGIGQQSVMRMQHVHDAFTDTASGAGASGAAGSGSGASGG